MCIHRNESLRQQDEATNEKSERQTYLVENEDVEANKK